MQKFLEKYLLPLAMVIGIAFHKQLSVLSPVTPYLLSLMLFITYCRISWSDIRLTKFHYILLAIQYIGSALVYLAVRPFDETLAQAVMICVLAPTATSAPVVANLLGGNIASVAAFSLFSNLSVAFVAPLYLSLIGQTGSDVSFITSFWYIFRKVVPIIVLPFFVALFLKKASPNIHRKVRSAQIVSFYIWAAALTVVIGNVANFVIAQDDGKYTLEITIGLAYCNSGQAG